MSSTVLLARSARSVLRATLPGEPTARPSDFGHMLAANPAALGDMSTSERRIAGAAMIRARLNSATSEELLDLTEYEAEVLSRDLSSDLAPRARALCHAELAESYLACGYARRGNAQARTAASYADEADDDACRYRAATLLACSLALNGEFARAQEISSEAESLQRLHNWERNESAVPLVLADMMIAYGHLDAERLESIFMGIAEQTPHGPVWLACEQLATGWFYMLGEHYDQALAVVTSLTGGSDSRSIPRLVTGFALGLQAMAHVHRGEPGRALAVLDGLPAVGDHALCFDLQRSTAYLQLGEPRRALVATDGCIRMGSAHNLRTLPSILLRRAAASLRLGHEVAATRAFAEAFHLMETSGAFTPLIGLSSGDVDRLLAHLIERQPNLAEAVAAFRARADTRPQSTVPPIAVELTPREIEVAQWLRSDLPLGDIASRLFVSRNTVKSHANSIYRKLGASGREDAVERLEDLGFSVPQQDEPHPSTTLGAHDR